MFSTSLTAFAVSGLVLSGSIATQPSWQSDYRTALSLAAEQHKPLAVFIGRGEAGYSRLIPEGGIDADTGKKLRQNYICLYVDANDPAGRELAGAFGMTQGLVISDKTGGVQALRYEGSMPRAELGRYLDAHAKPNAVQRTIYAGQAVQPAPTYVQQYQQYQAPTYPAFNPYGGYGGMSFG
jgi:hypothetical protein